jgi:hypothetical protein
MKSLPGAAARECLSTRTASCMKADLAQSEGILQTRGKNGAKTEHQEINIVNREMTNPGLILCQTVI